MAILFIYIFFIFDISNSTCQIDLVIRHLSLMDDVAIQFPVGLIEYSQKDFNLLSSAFKKVDWKVPSKEEYQRREEIAKIMEAIDKSIYIDYFPRELTTVPLLTPLIGTNIVDTSEEKWTIWHPALSLACCDYKSSLELKMISTINLFIMVPIGTKVKDTQKKQWDGWQYFLKSSDNKYYHLSNSEIRKIVPKNNPRISNLQDSNISLIHGRCYPCLPLFLFLERHEKIDKRARGKKFSIIQARPNMGRILLKN